jgi:hypothetical protein
MNKKRTECFSTKILYYKHKNSESVLNFRDPGGYHTSDRHRVIWRRRFRNGELRHMTKSDKFQLQEKLPTTDWYLLVRTTKNHGWRLGCSRFFTSFDV